MEEKTIREIEIDRLSVIYRVDMETAKLMSPAPLKEKVYETINLYK